MTPVRNGVILNFPEYGSTRRADSYRLGDDWYAFVCAPQSYIQPEKPDADVYCSHECLSKTLASGHEIIIVPKEQVNIFTLRINGED